MRIALIGAGSLGTILGAYITKAGYDITLVDTYADHVKALNEKGAHVVGTTDLVVPVKACLPEDMDGIYDLILYMTKQTYNDTAFAQMKPHVGPNTIIVTTQNGLPEVAVADVFGEENVMGCPVGWGATFKGPGVSELTSDPEHCTFDLGRMDGKVDDKVMMVKEVLETMCHTEVLENLMGVRWTKVLINSAFSGMSTVMNCTFGEVAENPKGMLCLQHIANESIQVAKAAGIRMEPMQGFKVDELLSFTNKKEMERTAVAINKLVTPHHLLRASMLQDLEHGRKCEIDAIDGVVCDMGARYGVATPVTQQVVDIIKKIENGELKLDYNNIDLFTFPEVAEN